MRPQQKGRPREAIFKGAYLKSGRSYQNVVNYKNMYNVILIISVVDNFLIARPLLKYDALKFENTVSASLICLSIVSQTRPSLFYASNLGS